MAKPRELFERGAYRQVLEATVESASGRFTDQDAPFAVGALAFLGKLEEAEALFERRSARLDAEGRSAARFFLGISFCRHSFPAKARAYLGANLLEGRRSRKAILRFHAFQGLGFYRFFCGRFARAIGAARAASRAADEARTDWGKLVSRDLLGHSLIQAGEVAQGLRCLDEAITRARSLGDGGIRQAVEVSIACTRAQFGAVAGAKSIARLKELIASLAIEDTYSRSALLLELSRQLTLCGRLEEAQRVLNDSCTVIYGSRNRRHGVLLNLRYALLHHLRGEHEQALNLIRGALLQLDVLADGALEVEVLGLQARVLGGLGMDADTAGRIRFLTQFTGKGISARILARDGAALAAPRSPGEDPLGDLIDRVRSGTNASSVFAEVVRSGYLGLLGPMLGARGSDRVVFLDPIPGAIVVYDRGSIQFRKEGATAILRKIFHALEGGREVSKQELIEKAWGYRYRPLDHDPLVYSTLSRLRKTMGAWSAWLEVTENGYRLLAGVEVRFGLRMPEPAQRPAATKMAEKSRFSDGDGLNFRQLSILRMLEQQEFLNVHDCRKRFRVSEITASRDLSALARRGLIRKIGKARATCYSAASR